MKTIDANPGKRESQIAFHAKLPLGEMRPDGDCLYRAYEIDDISTMLEKISTRNLTLMDLSVQESAPEEIYVKLMTDSTE